MKSTVEHLIIVKPKTEPNMSWSEPNMTLMTQWDGLTLNCTIYIMLIYYSMYLSMYFDFVPLEWSRCVYLHRRYILAVKRIDILAHVKACVFLLPNFQQNNNFIGIIWMPEGGYYATRFDFFFCRVDVWIFEDWYGRYVEQCATNCCFYHDTTVFIVCFSLWKDYGKYREKEKKKINYRQDNKK